MKEIVEQIWNMPANQLIIYASNIASILGLMMLPLLAIILYKCRQPRKYNTKYNTEYNTKYRYNVDGKQ